MGAHCGDPKSATSTVTDAAAQNPGQAASLAPEVDPAEAEQAAENAQQEAGQAAAGQRADQGHGGASCVAWTPENTCDGVIRP